MNSHCVLSYLRRYLLESLIETFADEQPRVRLQLLTSTMKLFFKRPPECMPILGTLLAKAVADSSDVVCTRFS